MSRSTPPILLVPLALFALTTACVVHGHGRGVILAPVPVGVVYVHREPPPVRVERIPPPPSVVHAWVPGHWVWDRGEYVWISGHYLERPHSRAVWVEGRWERHDRGWYWIEGRWR